MTPSEQLFIEALMAGDEPLTLADLVVRPGWMAAGLCRDYPQVEFHPRRGESSEPAKALCRQCLCRVACLDYALAEGIDDGIWGGVAPRGRQALRKAQTAA